ncbi:MULTISPECIES: YbaN family protein [Gracilibacillus]|uniref:YbaN family protein n=1 Tax=Gracilibacillus TaxID=74385 RepID=UPI0008246FD6|nr:MULTISPECIES: YbaN family protein [Gracilibacillus]
MRKIRRLWFLTMGTLSLLSGLIGIIVPILPTTPFIILAAFCFGKASPRLHHWLITNRYFGRYIADYQQGKGVPVKIKIGAVCLVWTSVVFSLFFIPLSAIKVMMIGIAIFVTIFIFTSPLLKEKQDVYQESAANQVPAKISK